MQSASRKIGQEKGKKADTQEVVFALHCTLRRKRRRVRPVDVDGEGGGEEVQAQKLRHE
jgi:hypothetical protein